MRQAVSTIDKMAILLYTVMHDLLSLCPDNLAQKFVFCRALENIFDLPISMDQNSTMFKGDIGILQYRIIKEFVNNGKAKLL